MLEETSLSVRIFEKNPERAKFLSERLADTLVLEGDVTQRIVWEEKGLEKSEMTIICTGNDERNALTTLMGQDFETSRLVTVVHDQQNLPLFESLGITRVVHPREVVVSSITDYVKESYAQNVTMLEHERGEVFEYQLDSDSPSTGKIIEELDESISEDFVLGAIVRQNRTLVTRGQIKLRCGDRLIFSRPATRPKPSPNNYENPGRCPLRLEPRGTILKWMSVPLTVPLIYSLFGREPH